METLTERTREALSKGKVLGDGHTIFLPSFYSPFFSEDELREAGLVMTYASDYSSPKSTIFDDKGTPLEELTGVYNLTFLEWLAEALDVTDYRICMGRGSQAQAIVEAIRAKVAS
jgi:hypothetical protein